VAAIAWPPADNNRSASDELQVMKPSPGGVLALLAGRVSGLLVPGTLAGQVGIPRTTLVRYLELLATVFLIKTIPAWSSGQTARTVGTPKLAFVDTGIVCHLIGQDAVRLDEPDGAAGPVLENFVVMELARQLTWAGQRGRGTGCSRIWSGLCGRSASSAASMPAARRSRSGCARDTSAEPWKRSSSSRACASGVALAVTSPVAWARANAAATTSMKPS
jgi:hypothetical protein